MNSYWFHAGFGLLLTLMAFFGAKRIYRSWGYALLNPVLVSIVFIVCFLLFFRIDFTTYNKGGEFLTFFLAPSVVALGVFLFEKYNEVRKNLKILLLSVGMGGVTGIVSILLSLAAFNSSEYLIKSLAAKSVTTPIAIEITNIVGGIPEITAGIVILVGILGNIFGIWFLNAAGVKDEVAIGVALGTASHGIGTAKALEYSKTAGVYSGLAMCLNGLFTAMLTPYIIEWFL